MVRAPKHRYTKFGKINKIRPELIMLRSVSPGEIPRWIVTNCILQLIASREPSSYKFVTTTTATYLQRFPTQNQPEDT